MQVDDYAFWRAALAGEATPDGISPQDTQCGFWRRRTRKGGPWEPVATWRDETGAIVCLVGDRIVPDYAVWDSIFYEPTTEEAYRAKVAGTPYPDEFPTRDGSGFTTDVAKAAPIFPPSKETT